MKEEARVAKEHYEAYGTQLNQNVLQISAQVRNGLIKWSCFGIFIFFSFYFEDFFQICKKF
ncbi:unnamed protein product [Anisakis simplex]|uniref:Dynein light chain n=1 Tax=Anisakis simplex TaxID=6269 RepID=A0A0M3JHB2_ANISI|nr:unnamed protein product [Anisakis simplex]